MTPGRLLRAGPYLFIHFPQFHWVPTPSQRRLSIQAFAGLGTLGPTSSGYVASPPTRGQKREDSVREPISFRLPPFLCRHVMLDIPTSVTIPDDTGICEFTLLFICGGRPALAEARVASQKNRIPQFLC